MGYMGKKDKTHGMGFSYEELSRRLEDVEASAKKQIKKDKQLKKDDLGRAVLLARYRFNPFVYEQLENTVDSYFLEHDISVAVAKATITKLKLKKQTRYSLLFPALFSILTTIFLTVGDIPNLEVGFLENFIVSIKNLINQFFSEIVACPNLWQGVCAALVYLIAAVIFIIIVIAIMAFPVIFIYWVFRLLSYLLGNERNVTRHTVESYIIEKLSFICNAECNDCETVENEVIEDKVSNLTKDTTPEIVEDYRDNQRRCGFYLFATIGTVTAMITSIIPLIKKDKK